MSNPTTPVTGALASTPTMYDMMKRINDFVNFVTESSKVAATAEAVKKHLIDIEAEYHTLNTWLNNNAPQVAAIYVNNSPFVDMQKQVYEYFIKYVSQLSLNPIPVEADEDGDGAEVHEAPTAANTQDNPADAPKAKPAATSAPVTPKPADKALSNTPEANKDRTATPEDQKDRGHGQVPTTPANAQNDAAGATASDPAPAPAQVEGTGQPAAVKTTPTADSTGQTGGAA